MNKTHLPVWIAMFVCLIALAADPSGDDDRHHVRSQDPPPAHLAAARSGARPAASGTPNALAGVDHGPPSAAAGADREAQRPREPRARATQAANTAAQRAVRGG